LPAFGRSEIGPRAASILLAQLHSNNEHKEPGISDSARASQEVRSITADNSIREPTIRSTFDNASSPSPYFALALSRMGESALPTLFRELTNSSGAQRSKIIEILSHNFEIPVTRHLDLVAKLLGDSDT